ncbi:MAG: sn-glycerol-1-phosphate dehydrogenase [Clostridia bacterium]|nr:sn-glycerol-1-phosphate dehydrogenase [Clostridia bacterium]
MDFKALLIPQRDCACGKEHNCPIDFVHIGSGALDTLPSLCGEYKHILLVADETTYAVCGEAVGQALGGKVQPLVLTAEGPVLIPDEAALAAVESAVGSETDLILGVGSGVINDICKYVSFQRGLPYFIVATAPSMDGYASVGAALILKGMKVTLNARPPKGIIADTDVLCHAPMEMLQAGYGDIIGKYSCLCDWKLSHLLYGEYFCQTVYDRTLVAAKQVESLAEGILRREEAAVAALMEALVAVGIAMSHVGSSRPASGSEHHLSHFFEITGILENKPYFSHGVDVAFSSVVTAGLREKIQSLRPQRRPFDRTIWEEEIRRVYSTSADEVIVLQDKMGWYTREDSRTVEENWPAVCEILRESPSAAEFTAMLEKVGLHFAEFEAMYGKEKIEDAVRYAKDLKDRYSVLWLYDLYCRR